jgi:tRNA(fMet)-specific endonuclease VapC
VTYLLDTDTCIYWLRNRQSVRERVREVGWNQITIGVITVAELYYGAYNSDRVTENLARAHFFIQQLPVLPLINKALGSQTNITEPATLLKARS